MAPKKFLEESGGGENLGVLLGNFEVGLIGLGLRNWRKCSECGSAVEEASLGLGLLTDRVGGSPRSGESSRRHSLLHTVGSMLRREILGLKPDCSKEDIKKAFAKLAKIYHPDQNPAGSERYTLISK